MPVFPAIPAVIERFAQQLRAGGLAGMPTETVYGLAGDACSDAAVAAIFAAKGRPSFNPLIVHVAEAETAWRYVTPNDAAYLLATHFWPGPLTMVLPRRAESALSLLVSAGLDTVAMRVPAHPAARALLDAFGGPLAAPSANRSGTVSPTEASHVAEAFPEIPVLDGGPCAVGLESTVVDLSGGAPALLRPGGIAQETLEALLGMTLATLTPADPNIGLKSPGLMLRHYAPSRPLFMNASEVTADDALLAFGPAPLFGAAYTLNLSPSANLTEAAANLFRMLRALDRPDVARILAMPVPEEGLGAAINDRLRRGMAR